MIKEINFKTEERALIQYCLNNADTKIARNSRQMTEKRKESFALFVESFCKNSKYIESICISSPYKTFNLIKKNSWWELKSTVLNSIVIDEFEDFGTALKALSEKGFPLGFERIEIQDIENRVHLINLSELN